MFDWTTPLNVFLMGLNWWVLALLFMVTGAIGGMCRHLVEHKGAIVLPHRHGDQLQMGILGDALLGVAIGFIVDHNPITSFFAGAMGGYFFEKFMNSDFGKRIIDAVFSNKNTSTKEE